MAAGASAYLLALVWTLPASIALPRAPGIAALDGTLWQGGATLADGSRLTWRWAPLRSLWTLGVAVDWRIDGRDAALAGRAVLRGGVTLESARGTAGGALLAVVAPDLPFACDVALRVALTGSAFGDAPAGALRSEPGLCAAKAGGGATLVPALAATLAPRGAGSDIAIAPVGRPSPALATGRVDRDGVLLRPTPAGLAAFPFAAP